MISTTELIIRLAAATLLGSIVGLERQKHEWAAGLRTHMLVCLGAALVMVVSTYGFNDVVGKAGIALDPSRVAAQVVSGIGFLGAGTILFLRQEVVRGLSSAWFNYRSWFMDGCRNWPGLRGRFIFCRRVNHSHSLGDTRSDKAFGNPFY